MFKFSALAAEARQRYAPDVNAITRRKLNRDATEYEIDCWMFARCEIGNPVGWEFLIAMWLHQWGDFFLIERRGITNHWLVRMAKAFTKFDHVMLCGSASSGKSFATAAYQYTRWKVAPTRTSCFMSTTSGPASEDRAWGHICELFQKDKKPIGQILSSLRLLALEGPDHSNGVKVVLLKTGNEGKNVVGSICGRKNERVIWAADEMSFMDAGILDGRTNLYSNAAANGIAQFIGCCNAPDEGDPAYMDAEPFGDKYPDGWRSIDKDTATWWYTRRGICVYFNGADSPNFKVPESEEPPFPRLMDYRSRAAILKDAGGEDTPGYWKQYHGFPPGTDVPDKILTFKLLEENGAFLPVEWEGSKRVVLAGLDLGFRADGDPCVLDFGTIGTDVSGSKVLLCERDGIALSPSQTSKDSFEVQIARSVVDKCRARDCHFLALDISGDGGILLQSIEREARAQGYSLDVLPVSFSGSADDRVVIPGEKRTARELYDRKVTQLWAMVRLAATNKVLRGMDRYSKAVQQLCSRKYGTDEKKRFVIEKKSEMKKRLRRSPDEGDARSLLIHLAFKHGLSGYKEPVVPKPPGKEADWRKPVQYSEHETRERYTEW